ncbi:MAG: EamA family transporter [Chloroflexota bacterium]
MLGVGASLGWGIADFGGGLASRRAPLLGVLLATQLVALAIALPLAGVAHEPTLSTRDIGLAVFGGVVGSVGLAALYRGLSVGRMGVVAPLAGVLTALIPVGAAIVLEGPPSLLVVAGIVAALASVVVVTRSDDGGADRPSGLAWGLGAGVAFGLFVLAISQLSDGVVFAPLAIVRGVEAAVIAIAILASRGAWRVPRATWWLIVPIGALDMASNVAFLGASHAGPLAIAASLSSLYPVVTVVLAAIVLREQVTAARAIGVGLAGLAIALIASGRA